MQAPLVFSEHAIIRMAQRHLTTAEVEYVIRHGRRFHTAGVIHCFLGKRDIPRADGVNDTFAKLEGTTVLLDPRAEFVITVYRNRMALKQITRKAKIDLKSGVYHSCAKSWL